MTTPTSAKTDMDAALANVSGSGIVVSVLNTILTNFLSIFAGYTTAAQALAGGTFTGKIIIKASATGGAGFNLPSGTAPTFPGDGDMWYDGTNFKVRLAGATLTVTTS